MFTKASVMQKYYIKAIQHQNEFPNEILHFESQCVRTGLAGLGADSSNVHLKSVGP